MYYFVNITSRDNIYDGLTVGGISAAVPVAIDAFNVHNNEGKKSTWFRTNTENEANTLAEWLASMYPGSELYVSSVTSIYQSEKPKVNKKSVSTKGVLPT